jgi:hypothetical protein
MPWNRHAPLERTTVLQDEIREDDILFSFQTPACRTLPPPGAAGRFAIFAQDAAAEFADYRFIRLAVESNTAWPSSLLHEMAALLDQCVACQKTAEQPRSADFYILSNMRHCPARDLAYRPTTARKSMLSAVAPRC